MTAEHLATTAGDPSSRVSVSTRTLLVSGLVAGPLYIVVVVLQALFRDRFDLSRHPASVLSNGDQGWIQIGNFLATGSLFIAFAVGLRREMPSACPHGAIWGPRLVGLVSASMAAAGIFSADPLDGFPPGTPTGPPTSISWHALAHFLVGITAFLTLIAACLVFSRHFAAAGSRGWAVGSAAAGLTLLTAWVSVFASQGAPVANVSLALALAVALTYTSLLAGLHWQRRRIVEHHSAAGSSRRELAWSNHRDEVDVGRGYGGDHEQDLLDQCRLGLSPLPGQGGEEGPHESGPR